LNKLTGASTAKEDHMAGAAVAGPPVLEAWPQGLSAAQRWHQLILPSHIAGLDRCASTPLSRKLEYPESA
jgi:hypothetical protein